MSSSKHAKLAFAGERSRDGAHHPVRLPGTCAVGDRAAEDVLLTELSAIGCRLLLVSIGVTKGEPVTLAIGAEPAIAGRLNWIKQGLLGIAFDTPLGADALKRILALELPSNVVPLGGAAD